MFLKKMKKILLAVVITSAATGALATPALRIGYSDWPGWVAWQIAIEKRWFEQAGVAVDFQWFDYSASVDAYAAGRLDAVAMTNQDVLITGALGAKSKMILINDYSNGNDMIVAKKTIRSIRDLAGKRVAVEKGLVDHLLLLHALEKAGMHASEVTLVHAKTNAMPQMLRQPEISAVAAWQPIAGQAMQMVPGAHPIVTSADEPGLIYDVLAVTPRSAYERKADWIRLIAVWDRIVAYIDDPKTHADAIKIMAARVGVTPEKYEEMLRGTKLMPLSVSITKYEKDDGFDSLSRSTEMIDRFNLRHGIYSRAEKIDDYIDASFTKAALQSSLKKTP